jgi:4-amino-4-deoxy-L-arabinose transferase-like glycosyltransferase
VKRAILASTLLVFGVLTLAQLDLPGLYYDEALDVVPSMQLLLGQPVTLERGVGVWVGNTAFPVMIMDYVGAVNTYLMVPFFALLGVNVYSLRLMTVVLSAVTLVLAYLVGRRFFGEAVALLATFLLAIHPSFVFWSRMGITVTSVMTVFSLGSLLAFIRWRDRRDGHWFVFGCLLLGLGLWSKLLFLWWILALIAVGIALLAWQAIEGGGGWSRRLTRARAETVTRRHFWAGALALLLGAAPLIWYNVVSGATFATLQKNLVTTDYGVNNLDLGQNLAIAWGTFRVLLDGSYFWYQGGPFANEAYLPVFLAGVAGSVALVSTRFRQHRRPLFVSLALVGLLVAESSVTVSGHWATHLFISYPFPQLVIALCAVMAATTWRKGAARLGGWVLAAALVLPAIAGDLYVDWEYQATMNDTRGVATASNSIYKLADYLDAQGIRRPIAVDWGFSKNIQILTLGRVNPEEIYGFGKQSTDVFAGEVRKYLANPDNVYLFHSAEKTVFPRQDAFLSQAGLMGKTVTVDKVFYQQDGVLVYLLLSAR